MSNVRFMKLEHWPEGQALPSRATDQSAGYDIRTADRITLFPGMKVLARTGMAIAMPHNLQCEIRPRSGLATKKLLIIPNSPGTIDADYRGEVKVCLLNISDDPVVLEEGERIAQMVFTQYEVVNFEVTDSLDDTERGEGGFGSTGTD
jgi:dUTP pyrophosphatase